MVCLLTSYDVFGHGALRALFYSMHFFLPHPSTVCSFGLGWGRVGGGVGWGNPLDASSYYNFSFVLTRGGLFLGGGLQQSRSCTWHIYLMILDASYHIVPLCIITYIYMHTN